jgi:hypothetical protein
LAESPLEQLVDVREHEGESIHPPVSSP